MHRLEIKEVITYFLMNCSNDFNESNIRDIKFQESTGSITFEVVVVNSIHSIELRECLQYSFPDHISVSSIYLDVACTSKCPHSACGVLTSITIDHNDSVWIISSVMVVTVVMAIFGVTVIVIILYIRRRNKSYTEK